MTDQQLVCSCIAAASSRTSANSEQCSGTLSPNSSRGGVRNDRKPVDDSHRESQRGRGRLGATGVRLESLDDARAQIIARAFTTYFELINPAEEREKSTLRLTVKGITAGIKNTG